jgi:hypothetical protein
MNKQAPFQTTTAMYAMRKCEPVAILRHSFRQSD